MNTKRKTRLKLRVRLTRLVMFSIIVAFIAGALAVFSMSAASAAPDCDTLTETGESVRYDFSTCAEASSVVKVQAHASGEAAVDSKGRLILSFIMKDGIPNSGQQQCKTIPAGHSYVNNYYDSNGTVRWVKKVAPAGGVKICFFKGHWRVVKCGNIVIMKPPPAIRKVLVKVKWTVRAQQKIWSEASAKAEGKSTSEVMATQTAGSCTGSYAKASAIGAFIARARARAWGWSKSSSLTALQGQIESLQLEQTTQQSALANAKADARGKARTAVEAKIVCNGQPPQPEHTNPVAEVFVGEHAVDPGGTMPVFGRAKAFDGATVVLGSPVANPSSLGGVYNWQPVSTERDGVTPCESGYVCYQGYFRADAEGDGTFVATASDNKGGTFTTQPVQFKVVFINHPDT